MNFDGATFEEKRQAALHIVARLVENGHTAMFAGGFVRDMLLGIEKQGDIDIVTSATPQAVRDLFSHTVPVGVQFGVIIVVKDGIPFEIATFRSDVGIADGRHPEQVVFADARQDALRRDFTINGMFYDPGADEVIDYVGGRKDLDAKILRAIGNPSERFQEDYLRLLRAIRFAARFGLVIEEATWEALKANAEHIVDISPERIFAEYDRMLRHPNPDRALELLHESGLLRKTLPEIADLGGIEQPPEFHPEGDVFIHTVKALGLMAADPSPVLAWSVLLHDSGKKATMWRADRIRFNNHHKVGAILAEAILRRLRAPNNLIGAVVACVEDHMNFMNVREMRLSTLKKILSRPTIGDELELHRLDCLSSHGNLDNYNFVKEKMATFEREAIKPRPFLRGNDLIELGFKEGPELGKILREVYDLQLDERLKTREEALAHIREVRGK